MSIRIKVGRWDLYENKDLLNYLKEGNDYFIGLFENSTNTTDLLVAENPFLFSVPHSVQMQETVFVSKLNGSDINQNGSQSEEILSEDFNNNDEYLFSLDDNAIETESEDFVYMGKENLENQLKKEIDKSNQKLDVSLHTKHLNENKEFVVKKNINIENENDLTYINVIEIQFRPNYDKEKVKLFLLEMIKHKELNKSFLEKIFSIFKPALNIAELDLMDEHIKTFTNSLDDYFYNEDLIESFARPITEYFRRRKTLDELEFKFLLNGKKYKGLVKSKDKTLLLGDLSGNSNSQNKLPILIEKIKSRRGLIVHDLNYKFLIQK